MAFRNQLGTRFLEHFSCVTAMTAATTTTSTTKTTTTTTTTTPMESDNAPNLARTAPQLGTKNSNNSHHRNMHAQRPRAYVKDQISMGAAPVALARVLDICIQPSDSSQTHQRHLPHIHRFLHMLAMHCAEHGGGMAGRHLDILYVCMRIFVKRGRAYRVLPRKIRT